MAPLTPLEQREWRKQAQRTVRISTTSIRSSWTSFESASESGHTHLKSLSDTLILLTQVHSMPLGSLSEVQGVRAKAARKLARQYQTTLNNLSKDCEEIERLADAACLAANAILEIVSMNEETGGIKGGSMRPWEAICPVFASIPAPKLHMMLREVYSMMLQESRVKSSICRLFYPDDSNKSGSILPRRVYDALVAAADNNVQRQGKASSLQGEDEMLRSSLTVALTTWITNPYLNNERYNELIHVVSDEMSGF